MSNIIISDVVWLLSAPALSLSLVKLKALL